jgi:hypothetical protein
MISPHMILYGVKSGLATNSPLSADSLAGDPPDFVRRPTVGRRRFFLTPLEKSLPDGRRSETAISEIAERRCGDEFNARLGKPERSPVRTFPGLVVGQRFSPEILPGILCCGRG